jgi:integrase
MYKLKLPKSPFKGIKIYCNKCKLDNPTCNHYDDHRFRIRIHVSGTKNSIKSKILDSREYEKAVKQAIEFKAELLDNGYERIKTTPTGNDYSVADAIVVYNRYLGGEHQLAHHVKNVSKAHQEEAIRFCKYFAKSVKTTKDISRTKIVDVNQNDVSNFYRWAEKHYAPRTFNKCMGALKAFFNFLIDVEEIKMKNPFKSYQSKSIAKNDNLTLTKEEFNKILSVIDSANPIHQLGGKGEKKNMHRPYLALAFKMFLLTGGRREEVVNLRWNELFITVKGVRFFKISNLKVTRKTGKDDIYKYIPVNADLEDLLFEMGYEEKKETDEFILCNDRTIGHKTLMDTISKAFTHYKKAADIQKDVSLKNLRKTYISWVNQVMARETGLLTSHATHELLLNHYIDPTILSAIEKGAAEIKIFG